MIRHLVPVCVAGMAPAICTVCTSFILCSLWVISVAVQNDDRPAVNIKDGIVAGQRVTYRGKELDTFYGIPYAQPPVGELRYERPKARKPWTGTLDATRKPSSCLQVKLLLLGNTTLNYSDASEDCLYVNVIRPACTNASRCYKSRPVMVLIHGGAFQVGDSSLFYFDGKNFVATTNIIVVSFNYRVGVFGFLSTDSPVLPGNAGLWDQVLALKWVKENIENFGGDPEKIAIRGQSAGGISAGLHAISLQSSGLFKRIIMESGTPLSMSLTQMYAGVGRVINLAGRLGCYNNDKEWAQQIADVVMCMKTKSTADIIYNINQMQHMEQVFFPVFGDEFMPESPLEMNPLNFFVGTTEIFAGTTLNEGTVLVNGMQYIAPRLFGTLTEDWITRTGITLVTSLLYSIPLGESKKIVEAYYDGHELEHDRKSVFDILSEMIGDASFECPTNLFLMAAAEQGIHTYRYQFAYRPSHSFWPRWMGVAHGDDLPYTLGSLRHLKEEVSDKNSKWRYLFGSLNITVLTYLPTEEDFMNQLLGIWSSFVANGKPTVPLSDEPWPKYSASSPDFYYLQPNNYTRGRGPKLDRCELWRPYLMKQKTAPQTARPKPTPRRRPTSVKKPASRNGGTTGPIDNTIISGADTFALSRALLAYVAFTSLLLR